MNSKKFSLLLSKYRESKKAVKKLYEYFYPLIVRYINVRFRGEIDGRDVAHTFFERLFKIKPYTIRSPNAWVYTVTKNIALEILRQEGKESKFEEQEILFQKIDLPNDVIDFLQCLTDIEQKIIYLRYWEKYRLNEIAEILKIKYGSVKYFHRTAKKKLQKEFNYE